MSLEKYGTAQTAYWPGTSIPKSTGNAFDRSIPRPSGFDTPNERAKVTRLLPKTATCQAFEVIDGLSKKARQQLQVPSSRVGIVIEKSAPARVRRIPKAQRSN